MKRYPRFTEEQYDLALGFIEAYGVKKDLEALYRIDKKHEPTNADWETKLKIIQLANLLIQIREIRNQSESNPVKNILTRMLIIQGNLERENVKRGLKAV